MQCPYCKMENAEAATHCAFCRQPLAAAQTDCADGIWLIPPVPAEADGPSAALSGEVAPPQTQGAAGGNTTAKKADKWLPRLVFFLGIFIIGVGLGLSGSNWLKLSDRAPPAAHEEEADKPEADNVPAGVLPQQSAAVPAPTPTPAPTPAPAAADPQPAGTAQAAPASVKPAPKRHRRVAKHKKIKPSRSPAANAGVLAQLASRPHRAATRKKPCPCPQKGVPPVASLQTSAMAPGNKQVLLNQCQNLDSWIEREKCKWHFCSNQWGQHGCPAYPPPRSQQ